MNLFDNNEIKEINVMKPELRKEGCEMTGIKLNDDKSVTFEFMHRATKAILNQRYFLPTRKDANQSDDDFKKNISLTISSVAHIARAFLTEEQFKAINAGPDGGNLAKVEQSWLTYVKNTGAALKDKYKGVECALKVTYRKSTKDNKYYSSLPSVPAFISTANHPKEFTTDPKYDFYEIPKASATFDTEQATQQETFQQNGGGSTESAPGTW